MRKFITPDREKRHLMPESIEEWLPEKHLARFVVEILEQMDLSAFYKEYKPSGPRPYDPRLLLGLLFYGYATGVFSSRKIEEATYDSVAFRFISGNLHPDHDTLADFRKRFLGQIGKCFVQILMIAESLGFVKVGQVNIDGTKIQANASKHSAMSYEHMERLEQQFKEEVERLMERAKQVDIQEDKELDIPAEIQRREDRIEKIQAAKIVGALANAHCTDTQELLPVLDAIPPVLGKVDTAAADNGYFSQGNVQGCQQREVDAYIAVGKQAHNQWLDQQLAKQELEPLGEHATPSMQMSHKLKTEIGCAIYRLRKMTVEPVFGIIKEIMGFRRFSLRGEESINGEWLLVCSAFNLKRLFVLVNA